ncbi:cytochrome P450 [Sphingomonas sp. AR_OL41]|uniref:cytochrome P450 n=1 Tax=Sphingomonas sp. AR_OL41 TaxID=3042729 RepID=UPI00247FBAA3|nr:cytochrome P450 [Sphingomonas sp. AR_OL41]MDH7975724.1 cytochrome P450 [Sphingomonas sp. AR_OL41]
MNVMATQPKSDPTLSLYRLLDPAVLADPYPLYARLCEEDPVHWDQFLHCWVVTRYADVHQVLHSFSADRTPSPEAMRALGLGHIEPIAEVMVKQMLFLDAPDHTRLRKLCSTAFTPRRVELLEGRIETIANDLIDKVIANKRMDVVADFAAPFPAIVTAHLLGVPAEDHAQLKAWSSDFAEMLGNFQHNPERIDRVLKSVADMTGYFRRAVREEERPLPEGLIRSLVEAEIDGNRLSEEEVIANTIVTMVGGQETTTNLIGNGLLTLLRQPDKLAELRDHPEIAESAIEELLRFETPSQHTGRICREDTIMGGKLIKKGDAVMAVMAAGNRDPRRFADPNTLDLRRTDNRHLAFGWAAHFCFGAPLARMEGRIAFTTLLRRLPELALGEGKLLWRENLGLRGLKSLQVTFA